MLTTSATTICFVYIYIFIYRESYVVVHVYIYIHIYTDTDPICVNIYSYIYIYIIQDCIPCLFGVFENKHSHVPSDTLRTWKWSSRPGSFFIHIVQVKQQFTITVIREYGNM